MRLRTGIYWRLDAHLFNWRFQTHGHGLISYIVVIKMFYRAILIIETEDVCEKASKTMWDNTSCYSFNFSIGTKNVTVSVGLALELKWMEVLRAGKKYWIVNRFNVGFSEQRQKQLRNGNVIRNSLAGKKCGCIRKMFWSYLENVSMDQKNRPTLLRCSEIVPVRSHHSATFFLSVILTLTEEVSNYCCYNA